MGSIKAIWHFNGIGKQITDFSEDTNKSHTSWQELVYFSEDKEIIKFMIETHDGTIEKILNKHKLPEICIKKRKRE